ncbi:MAG TPA: CBS domain-containing protein [Rhodocyclaceae bacterium]|nr:CBS domain-containing protein [Rhodocyclaceae bacterium]
MPIGELCSRVVVVAERITTVMEAARLMRQHHVGNIVVVSEANGVKCPIGIVTDRDIVVEVVVNRLDPETILVGEIMAAGIATVREQDGVFDTMQLMRRKGVRRLPVVDDEGALVGIVAVDDLIQLLAEEMDELSKLIVHEQVHEAQIRQ